MAHHSSFPLGILQNRSHYLSLGHEESLSLMKWKSIQVSAGISGHQRKRDEIKLIRSYLPQSYKFWLEDLRARLEQAMHNGQQ